LSFKNEIVRFYNRSDITFKRGKNTEATLVAVPSFWCLSRYEKELKKQNSIIDTAVSAISRSSNTSLNDACETFLSGMYHKFEDPFLSIAVKQGVANQMSPKVMDEVSVEAMLNKAGVNWTNARVIF
jgi:hypothetical protein